MPGPQRAPQDAPQAPPVPPAEIEALKAQLEATQASLARVLDLLAPTDAS